MIVIAPIAADVDAAIVGGATTKNAPLNNGHLASVEAGVGLGGDLPIEFGSPKAHEGGDGEFFDFGIVIGAAGFEKQNAGFGVGAEAVGKDTASSAGADNDVVVAGFNSHGSCS